MLDSPTEVLFKWTRRCTLKLRALGSGPITEKSDLPIYRRALLFAIFLLCACVRLPGIAQGLPDFPAADEPFIFKGAAGVAQGNFNPHFFAQPANLQIYVNGAAYYSYYIVGKRIGIFEPESTFQSAYTRDQSSFNVISRLINVACGLGLVWVVFHVTAPFGLFASGVAALAVGLSPILVRESTFALADVPASLLLTLALIQSGRLVKDPRFIGFLGCGLLVGLGCAVKYYVCVASVGVLVAAILAPLGRRDQLRMVGIAFVGVSLGFLIGCPYSLLAFHEFREGVVSLFQQQTSGHAGVDSAGLPIWSYVSQSLAPATSIPMLLAGCAGAVFVLRRRYDGLLPVAACSIAYLVWAGTSRGNFERDAILHVPMVAILAAPFLQRMARNVTLRVCLAVLVLASPLIGTVSVYQDRLKADVRHLAARWIRDHVPSSAKVLETNYAPRLPRAVRLSQLLPVPEDITRRVRRHEFDYIIFDSSTTDRMYRPLVQANHPEVTDSHIALHALVARQYKKKVVFSPSPGTNGMRISVYVLNPDRQVFTPLVPIAGDWDGDTIDTMGLFDPSHCRFHLSKANEDHAGQWTMHLERVRTGLRPIVGDWDGSGVDSVGVFDPNMGTFFLKNENTDGAPDHVFRFGPATAGWVPVAGDWNGDGKTSVGLYSLASRRFYLKNELSPGVADSIVRSNSDTGGGVPFAGNWAGHKIDGVGFFDPKASVFYMTKERVQGSRSITLSIGKLSHAKPLRFRFGAAGLNWAPVLGDWDGDGVDTVGLYDAHRGIFFLRNSNSAGKGDRVVQFEPIASDPPTFEGDRREALASPPPDWPTLAPQSILELGAGWSSNSINTAVFRHHGLVTRDGYQCGAFYRDTGEIVVFRRDLESGTVLLYELDGELDLDNVHDKISLGIDGSGRIHMSYPEHSGKLRYRRTRGPFSIDAWTPAIPMTSVREDRVTDPTFLMPPDAPRSRQAVVRPGFTSEGEKPSLLLLYRHGRNGKGDAYLKVYDDRSETWIDRDTPVLAGTQRTPGSCSPHWNHPAFDKAGRLHLSFVWQTQSLGNERLGSNRKIDYAVSPDLGITWQTSKGHRLRLPITSVNSETVQAVAPGTSFLHQTSSAVDSRGNLHVVFSSEDVDGIPQYQHLWFDGRKWRRCVLSRRTVEFELTGEGTLQPPLSGSEIVVGDEDTVYVIYRSERSGNALVAQRLLAPDYQPVGDVRILWSEPVGDAEPVIDRTRWKQDGVLSMLVQKNHNPAHDRPVKRGPEPVFLVDWDLEDAW